MITKHVSHIRRKAAVRTMLGAVVCDTLALDVARTRIAAVYICAANRVVGEKKNTVVVGGRRQQQQGVVRGYGTVRQGPENVRRQTDVVAIPPLALRFTRSSGSRTLPAISGTPDVTKNNPLITTKSHQTNEDVSKTTITCS